MLKKIAVIGSAFGGNKETEKKAYEVGKAITKNKAILLTGGCRGYPHEAAKGALKESGEVIAYSPAPNKEQHIEKYNFPIDNATETHYTGLGIPERNIPLVKNADAVIMISGQIGALNEFTLAFHLQKPIGVLVGSGGITNLIEQISNICSKVNEKDKIIYSSNPEELVKKLLEFV